MQVDFSSQPRTSSALHREWHQNTVKRYGMVPRPPPPPLFAWISGSIFPGQSRHPWRSSDVITRLRSSILPAWWWFDLFSFGPVLSTAPPWSMYVLMMSIWVDERSSAFVQRYNTLTGTRWLCRRFQRPVLLPWSPAVRLSSKHTVNLGLNERIITVLY